MTKLLSIILGCLVLAGCSKTVVISEPSTPEVIEKTACLQVVLDSEIQSKGKDMGNWHCPNGEDNCLSQDAIYAEKFEGNGKCTKWDKKRCYAKIGNRMREIKCGCVFNCIAVYE